MAGIQHGYTSFVVPYDVAHEVAYIDGATIYAVKHFSEVVAFLLQ